MVITKKSIKKQNARTTGDKGGDRGPTIFLIMAWKQNLFNAKHGFQEVAYAQSLQYQHLPSRMEGQQPSVDPPAKGLENGVEV